MARGEMVSMLRRTPRSFCSRKRSISFVRASHQQSTSGCSCTTPRGLFFLCEAYKIPPRYSG